MTFAPADNAPERPQLRPLDTPLLMQLMRSSQSHIVDRFMGLPDAQRLPLRGCTGPAVYVPGNNPARVLLVAHYDTVWQSAVDPFLDGCLIRSTNSKTGIGADDRCGIYALWQLRGLGHSLLLVPDEETGCQGSTALVNQYKLDELSDHQFAIQFDRRGSRDIVDYGTADSGLVDFFELHYPGYASASGSFSDIAVLCPALEIGGVNLSIGFYKEHTAAETCDIFDTHRTVALTHRLLTADVELPSSKCPEGGGWEPWQSSRTYSYGRGGSYSYGTDIWDDADADAYIPGPRPSLADDAPFADDTIDDTIDNFNDMMCPRCMVLYDEDDEDRIVDDYGTSMCPMCNLDLISLDEYERRMYDDIPY